jgi:hypothetical protein
MVEIDWHGITFWSHPTVPRWIACFDASTRSVLLDSTAFFDGKCIRYGNGAFSRQREARVVESLELAVESFNT